MRQIGHDLARALVEAALLMHQAGLSLDAITRVLYRRLISRRGFLQWTTAQMAEGTSRAARFRFTLIFWFISTIAALLGISLYFFNPGSLAAALPWLGLWFLTPLTGWLLSLKPSTRTPDRALSDSETQQLRKVARRTWRYFADFVGPETAWLPPDNYQVSHQNKLALRTSPTNIGMWMLSVLAAQDFGYITPDQVIEYLSSTMGTVKGLERYEGHLLNWYALEDRAPLRPRYVSSVDSGNFIAALWTLDQGLDDLLRNPVLDKSALQGLVDTAEILQEELAHEFDPGQEIELVIDLINRIKQCPPGLVDIIRLMRAIHPISSTLASDLREEANLHAGAAYWARQLARQVAGWIEIIDRYLVWIELLEEWSEDELLAAGLEPLLALPAALDQAPSLRMLAAGSFAGSHEFNLDQFSSSALDEANRSRVERLAEALSRARWFAGEMLGLGERLQQTPGSLHVR